MNNGVEKTLLTILCYALWKTGVDKEEITPNVDDLLRLSEEQTVVGLVFDSLSELAISPNKEKTLEYIGFYLNLEQQNAFVDGELVSFANTCDDLSLEYMVMKGQTLGALYPKPKLRMPGDIDFVIPPYGKDAWGQKVGQIFPGETIPSKMAVDEVSYTKNGQPFELHTSLRTFAKKKHQDVWDEAMAEEWRERHVVKVNGYNVRTLSPTINAAYVFLHLFFHFIREGVSLRQLCDWAVLLHNHREDIDRDRLLTLLMGLQLFDAYCAFGVILVQELGLPRKDFPFVISQDDEKWKEKILHDIFGGGNFGKLNHKATTSLRYKMETMNVAIRNFFRYYRLCPSEIGGMIPRLVEKNIKKILYSEKKR